MGAIPVKAGNYAFEEVDSVFPTFVRTGKHGMTKNQKSRKRRKDV